MAVTLSNLPEITIGKTNIMSSASRHTFGSSEVLNQSFKFRKTSESVQGYGLTFSPSLLRTHWKQKVN